MRILSPQWHFFLVYSSSSCLEASLVVAGVKEVSSCPFPACGQKRVKAVSLWCSGYSVSALPGRWQCVFCLVPPELILSFVAPCQSRTGIFPPTSMAKLQLTQPGDFLPLSPFFTHETFRNQSFNPFPCLCTICVCWARSSFTPLSQQGTLSIGGKEVTLEYTPCPEFWRCKRVSMSPESRVVLLPLLAPMAVDAERSVSCSLSG